MAKELATKKYIVGRRLECSASERTKTATEIPTSSTLARWFVHHKSPHTYALAYHRGAIAVDCCSKYL